MGKGNALALNAVHVNLIVAARESSIHSRLHVSVQLEVNGFGLPALVNQTTSAKVTGLFLLL